MDFRVIAENSRYGVRVSAIIIKNGKLLTYKVEDQNHLLGGAIEVGELSENAVIREVKEELGLDCEVSNLMFVVENIFDYKGELHHMIEFHYKVEILGELPVTTLDENEFELEWISLEELQNYDLRPKFLKDKLQGWNRSIQHINIAFEDK